MLRHKNIVELYHAFVENKTLILIMEYAGGGTLLDYVENNSPLGESMARKIFTQIATAIHYCHLRGVVHRDLKLENVLFKDDSLEQIKIIDFGIAGVCTKGQEDVQASGTPEYMPPESFDGPISSSPSQDIWAIGVMFYTMIYGRLPFHDRDSMSTTVSLIKAGKLTWPKGVPITD